MNSSSREHPETLLPWYVNGTLEGAEFRQVQEHLSYCLTCRLEVQKLEALRHDVQDAMLDESRNTPPGEVGLERLLTAIDGEHRHPVRKAFRNTRLWLPLAAAAMLLLVVHFTIEQSLDVPPVIERGEEGIAGPLRSAIEPNAVLPRSDFELRWQVATDWQEASFSLRVTTTDLRLIAEAYHLEALHYRVPHDALDDLPPSTSLLWQVEAVRPDGRHASSPTFSVELQ